MLMSRKEAGEAVMLPGQGGGQSRAVAVTGGKSEGGVLWGNW